MEQRILSILHVKQTRIVTMQGKYLSAFRSTAITILLGLPVVLAGSDAAGRSSRNPVNVVIIYVDDMGWKDRSESSNTPPCIIDRGQDEQMPEVNKRFRVESSPGL